MRVYCYKSAGKFFTLFKIQNIFIRTLNSIGKKCKFWVICTQVGSQRLNNVVTPSSILFTQLFWPFPCKLHHW